MSVSCAYSAYSAYSVGTRTGYCLGIPTLSVQVDWLCAAPQHMKVRTGTKGRSTVCPSAVGSVEYLIHDNGGYSFLVRYNATKFSVFEPVRGQMAAVYVDLDKRNTGFWVRMFKGHGRIQAEQDAALKKCFVIPVLTSKFVRVFVGSSNEVDANGPEFDGNTMLFEVPGGKYVCVSQDVTVFKPPERIESYHSPVYGSDVPYPYAVGATASYLVLARVTVPHAELQHANQDPYDVAFFRHLRHAPTMHRMAAAYRRSHPLAGLKVLRKRRR